MSNPHASTSTSSPPSDAQGKPPKPLSRGIPRPPRTQNPFSNNASSDRNHFPDLDPFLEHADAPASTSAEAEHSFLSHDAGNDASSELNMSIGARASLNEHLRYVAKYGIDGDHQEAVEVQIQDATKDARDEHWDYLLDHSALGDATSDVSFGASPAKAILSASTSTSLEHSIEVMTDVSQDFFNSSQIESLTTPERNRNKRNHIVTRGDDMELSNEQEPWNALAPELQNIASPSSSDPRHPNASFQSTSFGAPDISRISSADDSDVREINRSPNASDHDLPDAGFSSFVFEDMGSPQPFPDNLNTSFPSVSTVPKGSPTNHFVKEQRSPPIRKSTTQLRPGKENGLVNHQQLSTKSSALDTLPMDFLKGMESDRGSPKFSPISKVSSQQRHRILQPQQMEKDDATSRSSSGSSSSNSLAGRKLYRTVVPRRVYMDSPSDFPEEGDSFGTRSTEPTADSPSLSRSLLHSFEAAAAASPPRHPYRPRTPARRMV